MRIARLRHFQSVDRDSSRLLGPHGVPDTFGQTSGRHIWLARKLSVIVLKDSPSG
jgi:hypothetical protein